MPMVHSEKVEFLVLKTLSGDSCFRNQREVLVLAQRGWRFFVFGSDRMEPEPEPERGEILPLDREMMNDLVLNLERATVFCLDKERSEGSRCGSVGYWKLKLN